MLCTKCEGSLVLWQNQDMTVNGLECSICDQRWRSQQVEASIYEGYKKSEEVFLETAAFPDDAITDEDYKANYHLGQLIYYCNCYKNSYRSGHETDEVFATGSNGYCDSNAYLNVIRCYLKKLQNVNVLSDVQEGPFCFDKDDFVDRVWLRAVDVLEKKIFIK